MEQDNLDELQRSKGMLTERELLSHLMDGKFHLTPAEFHLVNDQISFHHPVDAIVEVNCRTHSARYALEIKTRSTPLMLQHAISSARHAADAMGLLPMVAMPHLSNHSLSKLESEGVSGVDLSGNGVILAPDFTVWRSGQPNRYPEIQSIKNLYRGASSLLTRSFLLRPAYASLKDLREYALARLYQDWDWPDGEARLTKGTVSKVVQKLEEDLLVMRNGHGLRVLNAERLMDGLKANYNHSEGARCTGVTTLSMEEIWRRMAERKFSEKEVTLPWRYTATGLGSAARYRVLSGPDKLTLYVTDLGYAADLVELRATRVFPNVELIEEKGDNVYFDIRRHGIEAWASPVQSWLELANGGPRERDAAEVLASVLADSQGEQFS